MQKMIIHPYTPDNIFHLQVHNHASYLNTRKIKNNPNREKKKKDDDLGIAIGNKGSQNKNLNLKQKRHKQHSLQDLTSWEWKRRKQCIKKKRCIISNALAGQPITWGTQ